MSFRDLFEEELFAAPTHVWIALRARAAEREEAADYLAVRIAQSRCGNSPEYFRAWEERRRGGPEHSAERRDVLIAHVASDSIGTSDEPAPAVHLEGLVAEFVWHTLTVEGATATGFDPVRIEEPSWSAIDAGGDGLVVYRISQDLAFCLWESKAHGGESVRDVVNGACRQLDKKAIRYLARMSKIGQEFLDEELRIFYGRLAELWRNQAREAAGGVSVTTSSGEIDECFGNMGTYWLFTEGDQRQGLIAVIEDFSAFAHRVRENLWTGL